MSGNFLKFANLNCCNFLNVILYITSVLLINYSTFNFWISFRYKCVPIYSIISSTSPSTVTIISVEKSYKIVLSNIKYKMASISFYKMKCDKDMNHTLDSYIKCECLSLLSIVPKTMQYIWECVRFYINWLIGLEWIGKEFTLTKYHVSIELDTGRDTSFVTWSIRWWGIKVTLNQ